MKKNEALSLMVLLFVVLFGWVSHSALAATSPSLGSALSYGVLSSTYTNTATGTVITGDVGFTTAPAVNPSTSAVYYGSGAPYATAGNDQATALVLLNNEVCDFTFDPGAIDLATDTTHGTVGIYNPGVYCIDGAASIGTNGITFNGSGTYIFRMTGALNTVANSVASLNGASACDIWWTPGAATTLGADSVFFGTVIDAAGITIGNSVNWIGRALAFGGTVTTDADNITVPNCSLPSASLTVVKTVINNDSGTKLISDFPLFVGTTSVSSGILTTFTPGTYSISETSIAGYSASSWGGDCSSSGNITLADGDIKICTITNDDNPVVSSGGGSGPVIPRVPPIISITKIPSPLALPSGPGLVTYTYTVLNAGTVVMRDVKVVDDKCSDISFVSGDVNNDSLLNVDEKWIFRCTSQVTQTTKNIATVVGYDYGGLSATDVANATVIVGQPTVPPLIHVLKVPNPLSLPTNGGIVKYTYTVTNPGTVALSDVKISDDKCQSINFLSGDVDADKLLDISETWLYSCQINITKNTVNTVTVRGSANGLMAFDYAFSTVLLSDPEKAVVASAVIPKLPNTGLDKENFHNNFWYVIALVSTVSFLSLLYVIRKKRPN